MKTFVVLAAIVFLVLAIMLLAFPTSAPTAWIYQHVVYWLGLGHVGEPARQFGLRCGAIAVVLLIYRWRKFGV